MKNQKDINKIVNISEDRTEVTIVDYLFEYNSGMKGATGSRYAPYTEAQIQDRIGDYLDDDKELLIYMAENFGELNRQIIESVDSSREGLIELFFDNSIDSSPEHEIEVRKYFPEDEYPVIDCIGGGRCFDEDYQGNINPEISKEIREYESK